MKTDMSDLEQISYAKTIYEQNKVMLCLAVFNQSR